jgi:type I restriction enzyme, S subunit
MKLEAIPLSSLASVKSGGGAPQDPSAFTTTGFPFVRAGSLPKLLDGDDEGSLEQLEPEVAVEHGLSLFPAGTVLFAKSGMSATKGHVYRLKTPAYVVNHLAALISHKPEDSAFLVRVLQRFSPTSLIKDAAYPSIRLGDIENMKVLAPPDSNGRRRIAEILDKVDALRAKRRAALARLDTLSQSIFLDMFGDPATNPKGWPKRAFGEVCETKLGKMLDQKQQTGKHQRPYLRNANVQWFRFDLTNLLEMDFDEDDRRVLRLKPGDLLICEGGEPGRAAVWRGELEECYFQKALHRARPNPNLACAEYLSWLLWFLARRGTLSGITSATIAHLTGEKLAILPTMLPPQSLQREFASRLDVVGNIARAHLAVLTGLDALFSSLQHRAFRGEL